MGLRLDSQLILRVTRTTWLRRKMLFTSPHPEMTIPFHPEKKGRNSPKQREMVSLYISYNSLKSYCIDPTSSHIHVSL